MQVTEKGQVTIPKDVRLAAGVVPGSEVAITFEAGRIVIQKLAGAKKPDRRAQLQRAAAKAQKSMSSHFRQMSAEAIMEFMRPPEKA
jgi:AbrB family looped-hinge helix DNA binding protein